MMHAETWARLREGAKLWAVTIAVLLFEGLIAVAVWSIAVVVSLNWIGGWALDRGSVIGIALILGALRPLLKTCEREHVDDMVTTVRIDAFPSGYRARTRAEAEAMEGGEFRRAMRRAEGVQGD